MFAEHHGTVQHSWDTHIVDERSLAEGLLEAAIAGRGVSDSESVSIALAVSISILAVCELCLTAKSELFSEIGVAARFLAWKFAAVFPGVAGGLNGVKNSRVAGAAA